MVVSSRRIEGGLTGRRENEAMTSPNTLSIEPKGKLWLEYDQQLAMSDYRLRLLEAIHETGSLAAAAQRMGLSYRRAWGKVRDLENNLHTTLVDSAAGGPGGGGSRLSPEGLELVRRYNQFASQSRRAIAEIFDAVFNPPSGPTDPDLVESDRGGPR